MYSGNLQRGYQIGKDVGRSSFDHKSHLQDMSAATTFDGFNNMFQSALGVLLGGGFGGAVAKQAQSPSFQVDTGGFGLSQGQQQPQGGAPGFQPNLGNFSLS